ncbi:hypothetical protein I4I78_14395 [Pseudonocardia sp. KRD-291]|nr:hypothetical protein [Pseudonocardia sp. KRD291]
MTDQLPAGTVVDGELVAMRDGRVDFTALTSRDSARRFLVFDVLAVAGRDVRAEPYRDRRARLVGLSMASRSRWVWCPPPRTCRPPAPG